MAHPRRGQNSLRGAGFCSPCYLPKEQLQIRTCVLTMTHVCRVIDCTHTGRNGQPTGKAINTSFIPHSARRLRAVHHAKHAFRSKRCEGPNRKAPGGKMRPSWPAVLKIPSGTNSDGSRLLGSSSYACTSLKHKSPTQPKAERHRNQGLPAIQLGQAKGPLLDGIQNGQATGKEALTLCGPKSFSCLHCAETSFGKCNPKCLFVFV